jgi:hypothetical protein
VYPKVGEGRVDFGVPDATGLLEAIECLDKAEDNVLVLGEVTEALGGLNKDNLVGGELSLREG